MRCIIYSGEGAEEKAKALFPDDKLIDSKENIALPEECDVIGFVVVLSSGALPLSLINFINEVIAERDNRSLGYIFALFSSAEKGKTWAEETLSSILSKVGCVLSYYSYLGNGNSQEVIDEVNREEYKISGNGLFYRLFKRKIKTYND